MIPFLAVLAVAVGVAVLLWGPWRVSWRGASRPRSLRTSDLRLAPSLVLVGLLVLPVLYAALVLWQGRDRLDALEVTYVGKRLAWGAELPVTAGGSDPDSEAVEDLYASLLGPGVLRLVPADEEAVDAVLGASEASWEGEGGQGSQGPRLGDPVIRLAAPAPVVRVDGEVIHAVALDDGDVVELGDLQVELTVTDGALQRPDPEGGADELRFELPGLWSRSRGEVLYFPDVLAPLLPDSPEAASRYASLLLWEGGAWRLVLRDADVRVLREGTEIGRLDTPRPVPADFTLTLQVAWGDAGQRRLRTLRQDRIRIRGSRDPGRDGDDRWVEIRFDEPQRRKIPLAGGGEDLERGLVVPSSIDRGPELVELDERSARFHGLTAEIHWDAAEQTAELGYLGDPVPVARGELFGLGEGRDLMLVRVERTRFPGRVLVDLALLALFLAAFLGPALQRAPMLLAVVAPVGLLLADRLLFSFRAATQPPDFYLRGYAEARLALWLVPALVLFGWTAGFVLRRLGGAAGPESVRTGETGETDASAPGWRAYWKQHLQRHLAQGLRGGRRLQWPLVGLVAASVGCFLAVRGAGGLWILAGIPLVLAVLLLGLYVWAAGQGERGSDRGADSLPGRVQRWNAEGFPWHLLWAPLGAGAAIFGVRAVSWLAGMPETLRLPFDFRLLWTVIQLPLCALVVGLGAQALVERRRQWGALPADRRARAVLRDGVLGTLALLGFLFLAFALVGAVVDDLGLLIVHGLAGATVLALLVSPAPGLHNASKKSRWLQAGALTLAALPLVGVLAINLMPQRTMALADWTLSWARPGPEAESPAVAAAGSADLADADPAARMRASARQQLFRLYMLANPDVLPEVGLKPSERVAIQHETLKDYAQAAGLMGGGFHSAPLPRHLGITYLNDLMPMAFVLADFGRLGMLALALTYLAVLLAAIQAQRRVSGVERPGAAGDRLGHQGAWIATAALLAFALPGVYMVLANLNRVLFTGKSCALLALNSASDVLQSGLLLGLAAFGLALVREGRR